MKKTITLILVLAVTAIACSGEGDDPGGNGEDSRTIEGAVVNVESGGLNEVTSFDLRHDGETETVLIIEDHDYGFPLGHLNEHMTTGDPVRVVGEMRDDGYYALSIEDI